MPHPLAGSWSEAKSSLSSCDSTAAGCATAPRGKSCCVHARAAHASCAGSGSGLG